MASLLKDLSSFPERKFTVTLLVSTLGGFYIPIDRYYNLENRTSDRKRKSQLRNKKQETKKNSGQVFEKKTMYGFFCPICGAIQESTTWEEREEGIHPSVPP